MEKNRGLYHQIKEQDRLEKELEQSLRYELQLEEKITKTGDTLPQPSQVTDLSGSLDLTGSQPQQLEQIGDMQQMQMVARLHDYLIKNLSSENLDLNADELATELSTNRSFLFSAVKSITGKTLLEYITSIRVAKARHLLETTKETIDAILEQCGFASKSSFYRLFSENCNMPPAEYRRIAKKQLIIKN